VILVHGLKQHMARWFPEWLDVRAKMWLRERQAASEFNYYRGADLRYTLSSGLELRVRSRAEWCTFTDIFVGGIYDAAIRAALASANPDRPFYVLDLGANVGHFALRFLDFAVHHQQQVGFPIRLFMVEPSPGVMRELQARLTLQVPPNVTLQFASGLAGKRSGSAYLHESSFHIGNSLNHDHYKKKILVPYVDLEELTRPAESIDLLKCDVEGAELAFLENYPALLDKVNVGAMELHHNLCDTHRCRELLIQHSFVPSSLRQTQWFDEIWFQRDRLAGET